MSLLGSKKRNINIEKMKEIRQAYHNVFSNRQGRFVLLHMLEELGFFNETLNTEEEIVKANYARRLLWYCKLWPESQYEQLRTIDELDFMEALFKIPIKEEKKDAKET